MAANTYSNFYIGAVVAEIKFDRTERMLVHFSCVLVVGRLRLPSQLLSDYFNWRLSRFSPVSSLQKRLSGFRGKWQITTSVSI